jgi:serine/threonine-protein kinase
MNIQVGSTVGDYEVVRVLGVGGMGEVYQVRNTISDRIEAMKVLLPDLANQPDLADRFLREIKVQASLQHPNIASMHTAVRVDNQLLLLLEFVDGVSLEQKLKSGPVPAADAVDYVMQTLSALEYAHGQGLVHRDIKPANMMVTPQGIVKLMDFGIAKGPTDQKLTMTGATVGSLYYMSPEQIQGAANLDARSDLYSLGVSLYQMVTGKRPFDGPSQFAIMSAHLQGTPAPPISIDPNLPKLLNDVILMAVEKDVATRFQTAKAMRNALGNVAASLGAPVHPSPLVATAPIAASAMPTAPLTAQPAPPPPAPPATPAAVKPSAQPVVQHPPAASHRGQWMALGAVVAVLAIVAVIALAPWKRPSAASIPTAPVAQPVAATPTPEAPVANAPSAEPQPAASPAASVNTEQPVAAQPAAASPIPQPVVRQPAVAARPKPARNAAAPTAVAQPIAQPEVQNQQPIAPPIAVQPPAPTGPSRAELQEVREQLSLLGVRASGVRSGLQGLQQSQAARGMNLRGDMVEARNLMNTYLDGSHAALREGDIAQANIFMQKAERQIEKLEKFLGR